MTGLFNWGGGMEGTMQKFGFDQNAIAGVRNLNKPPPAPPEAAVVAPPAAAPAPVETPPPTPLAAETPAATPPPVKPEPTPATPLPDPYAGKRGEVNKLAQARARRSQRQATIIGSDTLG